jgi:poly-gamma-glutamate synthesis protein (capsule biosynthesis protein)
MQRKTWLILFAILILAIAIFGSSCYLHFSSKQTAISNQQEGEKEFSDFVSQKKELPQKSEEVSLIAVGDISYSRGVEQEIKKQKDINYPFLKIGDYLQSSDLVFGNFESPITQGREISDFEMIFRSNPGTEQALKKTGFSVLSLANNHTPDFGEKGLRDTFNYLENVGIEYVGAGENVQKANQPIYIERKGIKFAFFAYNDTDVVPAIYEANENHVGTAFMRIDNMTKAVKEARQKADFIIVSMHSGTEYADKPNDSQVNFAHAAIDTGADLIIGHHPHVVQSMEEYKGKYIFYSLGNFVFDQMWLRETKQALAIKIYFTKEEIRKISLLPIVMYNFAQPAIANSGDAENILKRLDFPLTNRAVYYWDNAFVRGSRIIIYAKNGKINTTISKTEFGDLDNDSVQETYSLERGQLSITEDLKIIWKSSDDWWIDDFALADSNNDGVLDINLSLWKSGDFGTSKPFWIKENDMSVKNHFFVYDLVNGAMKSIWGSSNLSVPNCEFKIADINEDGENELITIEGDYSQKSLCSGDYVAVWKWSGWGFSNDWRSEKGDFSNLEIEKIDNRAYIITD